MEKENTAAGKTAVCEWPNIEKLLAHIFGEKETGLDYIKQLYNDPMQHRDVLVLFSNGIAGKTVFVHLLKLVFCENMRITDGSRITDKPIVAIDDMRKPIDLSNRAPNVIITTTSQRLLVDEWLKEIGARVVIVPDLKHKSPIDFGTIYQEVPDFLNYLKTLKS